MKESGDFLDILIHIFVLAEVSKRLFECDLGEYIQRKKLREAGDIDRSTTGYFPVYECDEVADSFINVRLQVRNLFA